MIYMNDVCKITMKAQFITYAVDMSIFLAASDANSIITSESSTLSSLYKGVTDNYLIINTSETKAVFFSINKQTYK